MSNKSDEKICALLDQLFSMHEADYLYNLIFDENKEPEDVLNFLDYIWKCEGQGIDTDIDHYEKHLVTNKK